MNAQCQRMVTILILLFALPIFIQAQSVNKSPVSVPAGIKNITIKYGENDTPITLKPAEKVAFLFVYGIWGLEGDCFNGDMGVGRLCSLAELVKGVKTKGGETLGLAVDPAQDTNYGYDIITIGGDCIIRAIPRSPGLGAFAMVGTVRRSIGNFYYNPKGSDLMSAITLTEYGYDGDGFRRQNR
jgi:hypothetical protein